MAPLIVNLSILIIFVVLNIEANVVISLTPAEALIGFKSSLHSNHTVFASWKLETPPCAGNNPNWEGLFCEEGRVWGIKLEGMGITGAIGVDYLSGMPHLRILSLINNSLDGKLPKLNKVGMLKALFLSHNKFSGPIDEDCFDGMTSLKKLYLAYNQFTGQIPSSLATLPRLIELSLEGNHFSGVIPNFTDTNFKLLNFSDNNFDGRIPSSVKYLPMESFSGNAGLCGEPLQSCEPKEPAINVIFVICSFLAVLMVISSIAIILQRKQAPGDVEAPLVGLSADIAMPVDMPSIDRGSPATSQGTTRHKKGEAPKLVFLIEDRERFELPDLLNSSAETLGKGSLGMYYKACLPSGKPMVVKRFKHMNNVGREEFQEHMWRIGRLNHPNLLPPVAFYYRKEEKLLVSDYIDNVSLATYLHKKKLPNQRSLNWPARLKIIKGVAKGLLYLHNELPSLVIPHGHLKSSNVLLTDSLEPIMTDYALLPVFNTERAQELMIAYKSPEYKLHNRVTKKTDAWSLGVLILETITGKFPTSSPRQGSGSDIDWLTWVQSTAHEDTTEVFDKGMKATSQEEGDLMKILKIGLSCTETDVDKRYDIKEAVKRIEEIKGEAI